jgi:hypothetical protein
VRQDPKRRRPEHPPQPGITADAAAAVGRRVFALAPGVPAWALGASPVVVVALLAIPSVIYSVPTLWMEMETAWTHAVRQRRERWRILSDEDESGSP